MYGFYKETKPLPKPGADCLMNANTADAKGFVRIRVGNKTTYQHRHLYAVLNNIPKEMMKDLVVTPSCGRYDCINPDHLVAKPKSTLEYKFINNG
jgi:hypothetical protein